MQSIEARSSEPNGRATPDGAAADGKLSTSFLFETIIADAQWTALNIGTFTILMNACSGNPSVQTMWPWRHALLFDGRSMQLALRYFSDLGLPETTATWIDGVYISLDRLAVRSMPLVKRRDPYTPTDRLALEELAKDWRSLCGETISMLKLLESETRNRLVHHYSENNRILQSYLDEGVNKCSTRIDEWGEIDLPNLAQKRRHVRMQMSARCKLHVGDKVLSAQLIDVSQSGAGVTCRTRLTVGQAVTVEFEDGRTVRARVAWNTEERCGLAFNSALA